MILIIMASNNTTYTNILQNLIFDSHILPQIQDFHISQTRGPCINGVGEGQNLLLGQKFWNSNEKIYSTEGKINNY